jgi:autotransporter translocation and assembly factor TamB
VKANGPLSWLGLEFALNSSAGDVSGTMHANLESEARRFAGDVNLKAVNVAPLMNDPEMKSHLTGQAKFDVMVPAANPREGLQGRYSAKASEVRYSGYAAKDVEARGRLDGRRVIIDAAKGGGYGSRATTAGTVETGLTGPDGASIMRVNLHGEVAGLDLRNLRTLPIEARIPPIDSRLNFTYRVSGTPTSMVGDARLARSTLLGATLAEGSEGSFSKAGESIAYEATGQVEGLDLTRVGKVFDMPVLSTGQYESRINGPFTLKGEGTDVAEMKLDAWASLRDSTVGGAHLSAMEVEAHLDGGSARIRAKGDFANVDPARFADMPKAKGAVSGQVDMEAEMLDFSAGVTPESVSASGSLALGHSQVGDLTIDRGQLRGQYAESVGRIEQLDVAGTDLNVKASGTLALDTTSQSDLTYHLDSPSLATIGRIFEMPLQGGLAVDGRLTGNRAELRTTGTLKATNIGYSGFEALTAESRFDATVPNLAPAEARVRAESQLGFIKVAGQEITTLGATTEYVGKEVSFDATAQASQRNARAVGRVVMHPERQEVFLSQFDFDTQGLRWKIPEGAAPTVNYAGGDITVHDFRLVSDQQSIVAEGTIGERDSNLRAALNDIDLARLDTWLVGERRLGGVLNAGMTVTGPRDNLNVQGDFAVDNGAFRDFRYETLGGNLRYTTEGIAMDIRLQQGPQAWMTAKGTLPMALFMAEGGTGTGGRSGYDPNAPVDVTIDSSPIDLGLVQGFTAMVTEATGILEAKIRVTGTAANPRLEGGIGVTNGAFTVPAVGVSYTAMNGRLDLANDRAVISGFSMTDEHGRTLTLTGDLAVQKRAIGQVNLQANAKEFEVLHNDLGHIIVNSSIRVGGELRAPRIEGEVSVSRGDLALDEILELYSRSAFAATDAPVPEATTPGAPSGAVGTGGAAGGGQPLPAVGARPSRSAGAAPAAPATGGSGSQGTQQARAGAADDPKQEAQPAPGSVFDAITMNVRIRVPDALVVKGQDIRPPSTNTPIGLGNVNVTLGGDVRLTKEAGQEMQLIGQVTAVRGTYDFQGRRFDIQRGGQVRFEGAVPPDPALDITGTRVISGVETRVHIGGTSTEPELNLTSRPPLDEADILSLIIYNQPANSLGEGEQVSLAQRASALATGFVASKLAGSLGKALDLDVFEIQTTPESGSGTGASVTLGEQIGQRLYFRITQGVGAENVSQFVVDYQVNSFMRVETTMSQGGTATRSLMRRVERSGVDLIFFFSY